MQIHYAGGATITILGDPALAKYDIGDMSYPFFSLRCDKVAAGSGFDSVLELLSILHDLSISKSMRTLKKKTCTPKEFRENYCAGTTVFEDAASRSRSGVD